MMLICAGVKWDCPEIGREERLLWNAKRNTKPEQEIRLEGQLKKLLQKKKKD